MPVEIKWSMLVEIKPVMIGVEIIMYCTSCPQVTIVRRMFEPLFKSTLSCGRCFHLTVIDAPDHIQSIWRLMGWEAALQEIDAWRKSKR